MADVVLREAMADDAPAMTAIQNALLDTTSIEWRYEPHTVDERLRWLAAKQAAGLPVLVGDDDGTVVGWATYGPFRDNDKWPGYRLTVENTIHIAESHWGQGLGGRLLEALLDRARTVGLHVVVAAIDGTNESSIRLHERVGFTEVARMPQVGTKHGRWLDLVLLQVVLQDEDPPER